MEKIKVLIADDHDIVLIGIKTLLTRSDFIEIVAITGDGEETISKVEELQPNIILLDIDLPIISGFEVAKHVQINFPEIKVIFHTSYIDEEHIIQGYESGAAGYLPKSSKPEQLIEAIQAVMRGERYFKGNVSEIFMKSYFKTKKTEKSEKTEKTDKISELVPYKVLSQKEIDILKLITDGLSKKEIDDQLYISMVKNIINNHEE